MQKGFSLAQQWDNNDDTVSNKVEEGDWQLTGALSPYMYPHTHKYTSVSEVNSEREQIQTHSLPEMF